MFFPKLLSIATTEVITLPAAATLAEAARTMKRHNIRCVVVLSSDGGYRLVLASSLLAFRVRGLPLSTRLDQVELPEAETLDPDDSVLEALRSIRNRSEHLCLVDRTGRLVGIVSYSDLAASLDPEVLAEAQSLGDLIHGIQPLTVSQELEKQEVKFRTLFGVYPDATLLIDPRDGSALEFNQVACTQLGYTPEEFSRLRVSDYEVQESAEEVAEHIHRVLTQGRDEFETRHRCKDGRIIDVSVAVSRLDLDGRPVLLAVVRDISRRKRDERQKRQTEERLQLATEAANLGIWDYDIQQDHLIWDERMFQLYGLEPRAFGYRFLDWSSLVLPESLRRVEADFQALIQSGRPFDVEFQIRRHIDGELRTLRGLARVIHDDQGRATRVVGVNEDITKFQEAQREIRDREQRLQQLAEQSRTVTWEVDARGLYTYLSPVAEIVWGYAPDEVVGRRHCL